MKNLLIRFYKKLFVRKRFYKFHRYMLNVSLWGTGFLNAENFYLSGEQHALNIIKSHYKLQNQQIVVFDIGAALGDYSYLVRQHFPHAMIYAFEPHPINFKILAEFATKYNINTFNCGVGDLNSQMTLYSHSGQEASYGSLYEDVVVELWQQKKKVEHIIKIINLDMFTITECIPKIHFLKIDTEGNELKVLQGAKIIIDEGKIDFIQFEFNSMHKYSKVFFHEITKLLNQYYIYRMLPDGLIEIAHEPNYLHEQFIFQNLLAIRSNIVEQRT